MSSNKALDKILEIVHRVSGVTLKSVVSEAALGRLEKRMTLLGKESYDDYLSHIQNDTSEIENAINIFMNNHTSFFRETQQFDALKDILPFIIKGKTDDPLDDDPIIRVWSAACSTGEEGYSIAMTLDACLRGTGFDFEVLGTDIDTDCIDVAAKAVYTLDRVKDIPAGFKEKYFLKGKGDTDGFVKVKKSLRDRCRFEVFNLNSNRSLPDNNKFDVIFCRNALIYFSFETCKKVLKILDRKIAKRGAIVLGISEPIKSEKKLLTFQPCFYLTPGLNKILRLDEEGAA